MSQAREIRVKIASVKSTQKITRAMELVATSKMRKAQERMARSRPYAERIRDVLGHVAASHSEYHHPYLVPRGTVKRVGYLIVTSDRGLCGGLNVNLLRQLLREFKAWDAKGVEIDLGLLGRKGEGFFRSVGGHVVALTTQLGDEPSLQRLTGALKVMLDLYDAGQLDAIYIASNQFVNSMVQKPRIRQLLPLEKLESSVDAHWDYLYEPDNSKDLLDGLLLRYLESQVYQAVIENIACEQSARMVAMKSATENAGNLIKELQLIYNKARQASITREIAEIVGGAAAVE